MAQVFIDLRRLIQKHRNRHVPAAAYYEVYKEGGSENKKKRMIKVDKSRKESLTVI